MIGLIKTVCVAFEMSIYLFKFLLTNKANQWILKQTLPPHLALIPEEKLT